MLVKHLKVRRNSWRSISSKLTTVNEELEQDLKDNIALQMKNLQDSLKTQEVVAQEQKDLRIRQIQEALQYANQAQVTKPQIQQTQDVTRDTMFLWGAKRWSR